MRDEWEKNGTKHERRMGEKRDETPMFHSPISPIFPEVKDLPHRSTCTNQRTALADGKGGVFATPQHSLPRRLVRMLDIPTGTVPHNALMVSRHTHAWGGWGGGGGAARPSGVPPSLCVRCLTDSTYRCLGRRAFADCGWCPEGVAAAHTTVAGAGGRGGMEGCGRRFSGVLPSACGSGVGGSNCFWFLVVLPARLNCTEFSVLLRVRVGHENLLTGHRL